jgi:phosphatidylglycerophosphate synthase
MNLPNLLTILRIFFVPLLVAVMVADKRSLSWGAYTVSNATPPPRIYWTAFWPGAGGR